MSPGLFLCASFITVTFVFQFLHWCLTIIFLSFKASQKWEHMKFYFLPLKLTAETGTQSILLCELLVRCVSLTSPKDNALIKLKYVIIDKTFAITLFILMYWGSFLGLGGAVSRSYPGNTGRQYIGLDTSPSQGTTIVNYTLIHA